jgi:O-antigen/teichoic acid export membrane protein
MKEIITRIRKFVVKLLLTEIILAAVSLIISYFMKLKISDTLIYIGAICLLIGMFSIIGQRNNSSDPTYFMSKSVGAKSTNEINQENYKNRNSSMRFLIFMSCIGTILFLAAGLVEKYLYTKL